MESLWLYQVLMIIPASQKALGDEISAELQGATVGAIGQSFIAQLPPIHYDQAGQAIAPLPEAQWYFCTSLFTGAMRVNALAVMQERGLDAHFYRFLNPYLVPEQKATILEGLGLPVVDLVDGEAILLASNVPGSLLTIGTVATINEAIADFLATING